MHQSKSSCDVHIMVFMFHRTYSIILLQRHAPRNVSCHKFSAINAPTVAQSPTQWTNELSHHTVHYHFSLIFTTSLLHMPITCCWKEPAFMNMLLIWKWHQSRPVERNRKRRSSDSLCVWGKQDWREGRVLFLSSSDSGSSTYGWMTSVSERVMVWRTT